MPYMQLPIEDEQSS